MLENVARRFGSIKKKKGSNYSRIVAYSIRFRVLFEQDTHDILRSLQSSGLST